jgi:hypothetical protein
MGFQVMSPESYKSHDLALVVLKEPLRFGPTVRPVCIPGQGREYGGQPAVMAGWGRSGGGGVDRLMCPGTLNKKWMTHQHKNKVVD